MLREPDVGFSGCECSDCAARRGPCAAQRGHIVAGTGNLAWLGVLPNHAKRGRAIMLQPAYPVSRPPTLVAERLGEACASPDHAFWADEISLPESELIRWKHVLGHRQATDAYLLALAARHQGRLVTFDRRISPKVVQGAMPEQLVTLSGETPITP